MMTSNYYDFKMTYFLRISLHKIIEGGINWFFFQKKPQKNKDNNFQIISFTKLRKGDKRYL